MNLKNGNSGEPEHQNNGEFHTPNESHTVATGSVSIHVTETRSMRRTSRTFGQIFRYFKYLLSWILKLGFRTIFLNLLIIGICCYIFWESGKDILFIEPFEVPEQLAKEGYDGRVIVNKLMDQMDYIKEQSEIASTLTLPFVSESIEKKKEVGGRLIENICPMVTHSSLQTEQIDIQIPGAGISLNSIIQYIKRMRGHEPIRIIGEVTQKKQHNQYHDTLLKVTVRVKGKPDKSFSGKIRNMTDRLHLASKHINQYTRPIILAGYLVRDEKNDSQCIEIIRNIISQDTHRDQHYYAYAMWGWVLQRQRNYNEALEKYEYAVNRAEKDKQKLALAYNNQACILIAQAAYNKALEKVQKAIEMNPKDSYAYVSWGWLLEEQEKYNEAIEADVHPKVKNKKTVKALILLAFPLISKFFSRDYPYVPARQCLRQLYLQCL